jgi:predicted phage terminase large subunit-like protein
MSSNFDKNSFDEAMLRAQLQKLDEVLAPALVAELKEQAQKSFKPFFVQSWKHIEPGIEFLDNWSVDAVCDHLEAISTGEIQNLVIQIPPRMSKLISKDTPILTYNRGWTTHGDLVVGDFVLTPEGFPVEVIHVAPDNIADTKVTFTNGEEIYCNKEHLWEVWDKNTRKISVKETQEIYGKETRKDGKKIRFRNFVSNIEPIEFPEQKLPLDPYYFGNWLGDGYEKSNRITQHPKDDSIIDKIPYQVSTINQHPDTGVNCYYFSHQGINTTLKSINVWGNKHIPSVYKFSSIEQRKKLIAGLIDSDGCSDSNSRVLLINTNKTLIDDIYEVLVSLGQRPYIVFRDKDKINENKKRSKSLQIISKKDCWVVGFQPTIDFPIVLERKKIKRTIKQRRIAIKKIEYLKESEFKNGNCITINSERGVYLVGKTLIPTHNSTIVSVSFPCWQWIQNPSEKFITASAIEKLVIRDAVRSRRLLNTNWYKELNPDLFLLPDVNQKSRYENNFSGYRITASVSSGITGEGYSILLCDDLVKAQDANSRAIMESTLEWWQMAISTRRNSPDARRVLIMQRLATNDPIGWELDNNPDIWTNLILPMEFEPERKCITEIGWEDPRKEKGEILWPERFPPKEIKNLKKTLGSVGWAAQYQQNPVPLSGNIIKKDWFKYYTIPYNKFQSGSFELMIGSWDLTFTDTGSSYCVGQVWGKKGSEKYLIYQYRDKLDVVEQLAAIRKMKREYPAIRAMLVEERANGHAVLTMLKKEVPGLIAINPKEIGAGDKETRLAACSIDFEAGNVYFPHQTVSPWVLDVTEELTTFPKSPHDDIVDATTQALNWFASKAGLSSISHQMSTEQVRKEMQQEYIFSVGQFGNLNMNTSTQKKSPNKNDFTEVHTLPISETKKIFS